jgi:2-keto-3-deoxy-L-rhamnonate aldolase RhmA
MSAKEYMAAANKNCSAIAMIESAKAVDNLKEILVKIVINKDKR